jgi:hypothetical protein
MPAGNIRGDSRQSGAPEPLENNAWRIDSGVANSKGVFTIGDEIKLTLT